MLVKTLIDRAALHAGSVSALARQLGVKPNAVFAWRAGSIACPPLNQDRLLIAAKCTPDEIAAHVVERAELSRKPRLAASVTAFAGSLAIAAAAFVGLLGGPSHAYAASLKRDNV